MNFRQKLFKIIIWLKPTKTCFSPFQKNYQLLSMKMDVHPNLNLNKYSTDLILGPFLTFFSIKFCKSI
ncbi:hypothetical protein BpHYR1_023513 [Brachionus plicatilis]|uniref:Uncharacterized protein n=1 Tax=Brachionus plicatilis TaxID=10195 RepID=A0A3M7PZ23_BRAPC|nr:hypothetical protein BpHYR1_023513 [Brachionus plicatilis]